jgi:3-hydroxyisobutyrate dehydrogenase
MDDIDAPTPAPLPRVGVIGVGQLGGAMSARLLSRGFQVAVHDLDAQNEAQAVARGAVACATATGVGASCDVLIVAVLDGAQTQSVLFGAHGAANTLARGSAVLLCATLSPSEAERIAARLQQQGIGCLDAPVAGSAAQAMDGNVILLAAGSHTLLERLRVLVDALASRVFHIGEKPGDGARLQLVNNLLAAINLAGAAEALALAERLGLAPNHVLDVIEQTNAQSRIGSDRMRRALAGDQRVRAQMSLQRKDTRIALEAAREKNFELRLGAQAAALFERACLGGSAHLDDASILEVLRKS